MKKLLCFISGCIILMQCNRDSGLNPGKESQEKPSVMVVTAKEAINAAQFYLIQSNLRLAGKNQRTVGVTDRIVNVAKVETVRNE